MSVSALLQGWTQPDRPAAACHYPTEIKSGATRPRSKILDISAGRCHQIERMFASKSTKLSCGGVLLLAIALSAGSFPAPAQDVSLRDFIRTNPAPTVQTEAFNRAIESCATSGGGRVLVPPGRWVSGTIHLQTGVTLFLESGAVIVGSTNLDAYQAPQLPDYLPEAKWGKWHRALILGENVENVAIMGPGTIDGARVFDAQGEEHQRGPHTIVLVNSRRVVIRDLSVKDSANYAMLFQVCEDLEVRNVKVVGGWDGVHFRGAPRHPCRRVDITDCQFYTGDDSIAGRYWEDVVISKCTLNSSCNGVRLIGPAKGLIISDCLFFGPGRQPHRTSNRLNMLSGIILQPGAWDRTEGSLDEVWIANNTMRDVASPITVWTTPGNRVGKVVIAGMQATGVYRSALSFESWDAAPLGDMVVRNVSVEFAGGGKPASGKAVERPGVDARELPAWGVYARNVEKLTLQDVRLSTAVADQRPAIDLEDIGRCSLENVRYPIQEMVSPIHTNRVRTYLNEAYLQDTQSKPK